MHAANSAASLSEGHLMNAHMGALFDGHIESSFVFCHAVLHDSHEATVVGLRHSVRHL